MMDEGGFIALHRKLLDWEWYKDPNTFRLFIHLLLKANWKDGRFMGVDVPRGSLITSLEHLAKETGLTVRGVRTSLKHLKTTGEITSQVTNRFTLVTVANYDFYQDKNNEVTSQVTSQVTSERQTSDNNRTKKQYNNIYAQNFEKFWEAYPKKRDKHGALKAFKKVDADIDVLLRAIERQKQSKDWQKDDGQYIPYPSTWLNGHRWEDETDNIKPVNTNQQPNLFAEMEEIIKRR